MHFYNVFFFFFWTSKYLEDDNNKDRVNSELYGVFQSLISLIWQLWNKKMNAHVLNEQHAWETELVKVIRAQSAYFPELLLSRTPHVPELLKILLFCIACLFWNTIVEI